MKRDNPILFLGKEQDVHCSRALNFCLQHFSHVTSFLGKWGDPLPQSAGEWHGDFIISYLSRWVVPDLLLKQAKRAAFNFHPGSPDYPGIGCLNFALYEEAQEYGVTCHHMAAQVDTGEIIAVRRFPLFESDSVATLLSRTHDFQLVLFYEVMSWLLKHDRLPSTNERWGREPYTRKEFNQLGKITAEMLPEEIARRVRATSFGIYQPTVQLGGYTFELKPAEENDSF